MNSKLRTLQLLIEPEDTFMKNFETNFKSNFNLDAKGSQETVKFKFSLKDAKRDLLIRDISGSQKKGYLGDFSTNNQDSQSPTNLGGTISVSLEAEGPTNNPLQFEGTGKIHLKETTVGSINLLGKVSEGLKKLNLPVPTGALSFNDLEISLNYAKKHLSSILGERRRQ